MKNNFFNNLLKFTIGPLGAAVISFVTVPITTWLVAPEQYGMTTMFTLLQTLIASFVYLGIDQSYVREYHSYQENKNNLLFNAALIPMIIGILLSSFFIIFSKQISIYLFNEINYIIVFCLAIWIPFSIIERFLLLDIRMNEDGLKYSLFNILIKLLVMILTIILLVFYSQTYKSIIVATILGQIVADIIIIIYLRKKYNIKIFKFDKDLNKIMLKFGLPLLPAVMISWILTSADRIVLDMFCSMDEIGIYFAAMKIVSALTMIQSIFATFWTPMAYRWHTEKVPNLKFTQVSYGVFIVMGVIFILILLLKELFVCILSPEYSQAQYILPFLLFTPTLYTVSETTMLGINFSRKTYLSIWISLIAAISNIILNLLLVPHMGPIGASIATGVSYIIFFWTRTIISRRNWYKFNLMFYIVNILYLVIIASVNITIHSKIIYIINILALLIYILINFPFIHSTFNLPKHNKSSLNLIERL